jgi:hypothetical protein
MVRTEAEERVEHRPCNTMYRNQKATIRREEMNLWARIIMYIERTQFDARTVPA